MRQFLRDTHVHGHEMVPTAPPVQMGYPLSFELKFLLRLGACGNGQVHGPVQRLDRQHTSERGTTDADLCLAAHVEPVAFPTVVLLHPHAHVQITRASAVWGCVSPAAHLHHLTVVDTCRNFHGY